MRFLSALFALLLLPALWAQRPAYPVSKHGGTYMFNYYLPPAPSTTPWWPSWSPVPKAHTSPGLLAM